ncbi:MAG: DUF4177 domain-containing protein [Lysobacteraceae bacterium]|jgi:hypothetical protein|nr:MAG: DUF4177 domain-containing protein [Xanthomonadaceae bacterium]
MSTRWNYQVIEIKVQMFGQPLTERLQDALVRAGSQGWELVSSVQSSATDSVRLFLKKPA